jgi:predicted XRE-type DNA-binding protein
MTERTIKRQEFNNVWEALEDDPAVVVNMTARSDLMIAIRRVVRSWKITQAAAAKRLGLTQPRLNDLLRGRIDKFSLDALMNIATKAGLAVKVEIVRRAA